MKLIEIIIVTIVLFLWGYVLTKSLQVETVTVVKTVQVPPTDDQLLEFWFGSGDKASLRKRICK